MSITLHSLGTVQCLVVFGVYPNVVTDCENMSPWENKGYPSIHLSVSSGSVSVPPCRLTRTFVRETALLIKELIFSLLSLISVVNLKHCEFFKFSLLLSKSRRRKKDGNGGYLIG